MPTFFKRKALKMSKAAAKIGVTKKTKANAQSKKNISKPKVKTFKMCEIATKLVNEETGEAYIKSLEEIVEVCENWNVIRYYIVALHDREIYTVDDEKENPKHKVGTPKNPDVHIYLHFGGVTSESVTKIAEMFGTLPQNVTSIKSKKGEKGKWSDVVLYALHWNAPEKHQYKVEDLIAVNFDVEKAIEDGKKETKHRNMEKELDDLIRRIDSGEVREFNKHQYIDAVMYARKGSLIDRAFKRRTEILESEGNRNMEVFYLEGLSGSGKTSYAKEICKKHGWSYYVSSSSNDVLDGYKGQDALILDDLRPSVMGLSDLLKLLDNHTSSSVKSRFKNKVLECKVLFITTVLPLDTFFHKVFEREDEPIKQLKRRCGTYMEFTEETVTLKLYDEEADTYKTVTEFKNPIRGKYEKRAVTAERVNDTLEFLGVTNEDILKKSVIVKDGVQVTQDVFLTIADKDVPFN